jgi:hypothetical protein
VSIADEDHARLSFVQEWTCSAGPREGSYGSIMALACRKSLPSVKMASHKSCRPHHFTSNLRKNTGHFDRMCDEWFARLPELPVVRTLGHNQGLAQGLLLAACEVT